MTCKHKPTVGKPYRLLYHNISTRLSANIATETNEETDRNQISSISSIFNEMKTMMDDFRHGLPDFTENVITKKLDEQDTISLHA